MALMEDNSGNWRVGVLFSQTGVTSGIERTQLNATLLAIEEIVCCMLEPAARCRRSDIAEIVRDAGQHTHYVAIQHRMRQSERQAGYRRGGVIADARERTDGFVVGREDPVHLAGSFLDVASAGIVAEAAPAGQEVGLGARAVARPLQSSPHSAVPVAT